MTNAGRTPSRRLWILVGVLQLCLYLPVLAFICAPLPERLLDYGPVASVRILDREGGLLRELLSRADGRSTPLDTAEIPEALRAAFIAAEDKGFYSHSGISPTAIVRSLAQNIRARKVIAGGSTLSQQLARILVPRNRTVWGKIKEALWALRLEAHLSKEEILTQYLNRTPFGNNAFGVEAAAQLYFGRQARYLSVAQSALLAAIPRGPSAYNPYRNPARLFERKAWILERMGKLHLVDADRVQDAQVEPLDLQAFTASFRAPHFTEFIAANLDRWNLSDATVIETTLDPKLQLEVEDHVKQELSRLGERRVNSAAVLVLDNRTGEVLAYQGSADFFSDAIEGQNDGVQMKRQPGSSLKPFLYAEAFSAGFTPATVVPDLESHFADRKGVYSPKNYDRRSHGPVRAREALANSYNVPAVRIAEALGTDRVLKVLQRAGFESLDKGSEHYGLGLVLGNGAVSLWEGARAYAGLSRGGTLMPLRAIRRALRPDGSEIPLRTRIRPRRFAEESSAGLVAHVLSDSAARARAFGLDNVLRLPFPVAVKTGTSKGYSDNWAFGFTRERTVAVWAGNFDGTPMIQVSGVTGAGPIFKRVMVRAMEGLRPAPLVNTGGLEEARICPLSGELAGPWCPATMEEVFAIGTKPRHTCAMHRGIARDLPESLGERCQALTESEQQLVDLGVDFYDWAQTEGVSREPWLVAACLELPSQAQAQAPRILSPSQGDQFLLFSDLPWEDQSIPLRVRASPTEESMEVRLDDRALFTLAPPFSGRIPATPGEHLLSLHRSPGGEPLSRVRFRVRQEQRDYWAR